MQENLGFLFVCLFCVFLKMFNLGPGLKGELTIFMKLSGRIVAQERWGPTPAYKPAVQSGCMQEEGAHAQMGSGGPHGA